MDTKRILKSIFGKQVPGIEEVRFLKEDTCQFNVRVPIMTKLHAQFLGMAQNKSMSQVVVELIEREWKARQRRTIKSNPRNRRQMKVFLEQLLRRYD